MFRWLALTVLVGCLSISTYYRRRARRTSGTIPRTRETLPLILGRALVALPLFLGILAYLANPRWMAWAELPVPSWARWIGAIVGLVTVPLSYWVFTSLGTNVSETVLTKDRHHLVTTGPYRWIRHPLYSTGLMLFLAIGVMAANWFILGFALIALASVRLVVIPLEERELVAKFGDDYRAYMRRTGRLWPKFIESEVELQA